MGFTLSGRSMERGVEIRNVRGLVVRALILHLYFVSILSTFVINFFTYGRASPTLVTVLLARGGDLSILLNVFQIMIVYMR